MQLELKNLTKRYGSFTALDCMNITFTEGIYGILGANGAGKSTMMNLLTDNIPRTDGQILFDGTGHSEAGQRLSPAAGLYASAARILRTHDGANLSVLYGRFESDPQKAG